MEIDPNIFCRTPVFFIAQLCLYFSSRRKGERLELSQSNISHEKCKILLNETENLYPYARGISQGYIITQAASKTAYCLDIGHYLAENVTLSMDFGVNCFMQMQF